VATAATMTEFEEAWPRLAEDMRDAAFQAREIAVEPSIEALEYRRAVKAGKRGLVLGDRDRKQGDFRSAREAYRGSEEAFLEAAALREATRDTKGGG
jgi:hypothetical protein